MKDFCFLIIVAMATSCSISPRISISGVPASEKTVDSRLMAIAYHQKAAEYRALCLQAYNIAGMRLRENFVEASLKPRAIITDVDETVLDNSPYQAHQFFLNKNYDSESWRQWTAMAQADTVPGAFSFLRNAASKGVTIFYVTNRKENEEEATLVNLKKFGFPDADEGHLLLRANSSSKEGRRKTILEKYNVILYLGDNLADFDSLFDMSTDHSRASQVNVLSSKFGNQFIILPNVMYGDWESGLYSPAANLPTSNKDSLLRKIIKTY